MNGEGIMALPQDMAMPPREGGGIEELDALTTAQQIGRDLGPTKVSKELLSAGADVDPYEVKAFLDEIRAAGLTADDKEVIREIVRRVKAATPAGYQRVRQELISEGAAEELLPETFDPEFFIALELAVEADNSMSEAQQPMTPEMPVQGFAQGGIVELPQMKAVAAELAKMGRGGDTILAHITPGEAALLKSRGGSGTINPYTGLPEYKIGKLFKAVTKPLRKTWKAAKKFAKSSVGRIVIGIAAGMLLGPAAIGFMQGATGIALSAAAQTALTVGVGAFSSGILAGDGFKNSLKAGVVAGAVAYGGSAIMGGAGATATPTTPTGPQSFSEGLSEGWTNTKASVNSMLGTESATAAQPTTATEMVGQTAPTEAGTVGTAAQQTGVTPVSATEQAVTYPNAPYPQAAPAAPVVPGSIDMTVGPGIESTPFTPATPATTAITPSYEMPPETADAYQQARAVSGATTTGTPSVAETSLAPRGEPGLLSRTFSPSTRGDIGFQEAVAKANQLYPNDALAREMYIKANTPGVFAKYGPLAAAGLGVTYLAGGMKGKEAEPPGLITPGYTGEDYMRDNPELFSGSLGTPQTYAYQSLVPTPSDFGTRPISSPGTMVPTGITALPTAQRLVQEYNRSGMFGVPDLYQPVYTARKGSGPQGVTNFPRKTGPINGPGTGTSDSIPAMLSDGEFVFTAKAVRNMGGGSRRKGAARMYKMMKMLEGGPVGIAKRGK